MSKQKNKPVVKIIYDDVKKKEDKQRTQQAVLITVGGKNTVVNMAKQPSE